MPERNVTSVSEPLGPVAAAPLLPPPLPAPACASDKTVVERGVGWRPTSCVNHGLPQSMHIGHELRTRPAVGTRTTPPKLSASDSITKVQLRKMTAPVLRGMGEYGVNLGAKNP